MFKVEWTVKAAKQLKRIEIQQQKKIVKVAKTLSNWPNCRNIKALSNHRYNYRLRVGRFRIFFDVKHTLRIIEVEEVKKRNERTY